MKASSIVIAIAAALTVVAFRAWAAAEGPTGTGGAVSDCLDGKTRPKGCCEEEKAATREKCETALPGWDCGSCPPKQPNYQSTVKDTAEALDRQDASSKTDGQGSGNDSMMMMAAMAPLLGALSGAMNNSASKSNSDSQNTSSADSGSSSAASQASGTTSPARMDVA